VVTSKIGLLLAVAAICSAQTPEFEVASVKPAPPGVTGRSFTESPGGRLTTSNASLKMLIAFAYQVMPEQVVGGPVWVESDGFDIETKGTSPNVTQSQFRQMIQGLLTERFHMAAHRETRELPVYALVQARNGAKLTETRDDNPEVGVRIVGPGQMIGVKATMAMLAATLYRPLQRKVIDETGLTGSYSFKVRFAPEPKRAGTGAEAAPASDSPSIFTALQEQLGLSLKPGKGPVEVVVVDHAEKPTQN
jgi:uncharacterized protein (TIGR03435 family)